MSWSGAKTWAANLSVGGVSDWRLANTPQPDPRCSNQNGTTSRGYNCTGGETGNLFYNVLGGAAGYSILDTHNANFYLFSNIQSDYYWLAEKYPPRTRDSWIFGFNIGNQSFDYAPRSYYEWAVQSGDVSAVPIPAAAWLFGSALLGLAGIKRR